MISRGQTLEIVRHGRELKACLSIIYFIMSDLLCGKLNEMNLDSLYGQSIRYVML